MNLRKHVSRWALLSALVGSSLGLNFTASADEGMWLFNSVPKQQMKTKYQFEPTQAWLDHVM
ncbi:MAG: hypothetical protein ACK6DC_13415, partial [Planctomycetota bacterium]